MSLQIRHDETTSDPILRQMVKSFFVDYFSCLYLQTYFFRVMQIGKASFHWDYLVHTVTILLCYNREFLACNRISLSFWHQNFDISVSRYLSSTIAFTSLRWQTTVPLQQTRRSSRGPNQLVCVLLNLGTSERSWEGWDSDLRLWAGSRNRLDQSLSHWSQFKTKSCLHFLVEKKLLK